MFLTFSKCSKIARVARLTITAAIPSVNVTLSGVVYLKLCGFCLERFPLPLGAWDGLRYFIVALPEPAI